MVRRAKRNTSEIAARFNVHEAFLIFVDHLNRRAHAKHFQEAELGWFEHGATMEQRKAELWDTATCMDGKADPKFWHVGWDDTIEVWTPTMTYLVTRRGIIGATPNS